MILSPKIKYLIKLFIPKFLLPFCYRFYQFAVDNIFIILYNLQLRSDFKDLKALKYLRTKKNVRIIQPTFYDPEGKKYLSGGAERYLTDLAIIIKNIGLEPYIIQFGKTNWHLEHEGINVFGVKSGSLASLNLQAHDKIFGDPKLVIYSPFALAAPKSHKKSIGISHGIFWDHYHSESLINNVKKSFCNLSQLVSVDTSTITWFKATMHKVVDSKKMTYLPNYVDLQKYRPLVKKTKNELIILFPRRLYKARGYFLVVEILEDILMNYENIVFHFVGQYNDNDIEVKKSKNRLINKYPGKVKFYECKAMDMHLIYQKSDITLIPTIASEGTSLSCLEAMASGNAVIATYVGGLSDLIINKHNGLLIEPSAQALKNAIIDLLESKKLRTKIGKNAAITAKSFCYKDWQKKWSSIIATHTQ